MSNKNEEGFPAMATFTRISAQFFEKEHYHVMRDVAKITDYRSGLSEEFAELNFQPTYYKNIVKTRLQPPLNSRGGCCSLSRKGTLE